MKQKKFLQVIPECYVDTGLMEYLLDAGVNHQHCCSKVVRQLNVTFKDSFAIGIIDKDKVEMGYIKECDEVASTGKHLTLLKHKTRNQFLITINPAIDRFILDSAKEEGVKPENFGLPSTLKDFIAVSKAVTSNQDVRFKSLFKAINGNREITNLKNSLDYLIRNNYQTDLSVVKKIFET